MGKTALCIQMLELLNTGRTIKASELANLLETNSRNIIEYKKELEECGYYITSVSGKYGGYKLDKTALFPVIKLTQSEKESVKESYSYLLSRRDFLNKKDYDSAMAKIISSFTNDYEIQPLKVVDKEKMLFDNKMIEQNYNTIKNAIYGLRVITFNYLNNKNKIVRRTVEPYKLYIYGTSWFLLGYCRELRDYRCFKIIRMSNLNETDIKFSRDYFYKESDFFDENGLKKNNDWIDIKFKIKNYPLLKLQEQTIGRNQNINYLSTNEAIVDVSMQYKNNIISYLLSLGDDGELLEPKWLKDEIIDILEKIIRKYK